MRFSDKASDRTIVRINALVNNVFKLRARNWKEEEEEREKESEGERERK